MSLLPSWRPITKRTLDLFGRWGDPRTNLRSMLSGIIPVAVVDEFRDDDRGSIFGINAFNTGTPNEFPAVSFGSTANDWELLSITALWVQFHGLQAAKRVEFHLFTPIDPYNPTLNLNPAGFFQNGLITNRAFTFGTVFGLGGSNPSLPTIPGPTLVMEDITASIGEFQFLEDCGPIMFDPPIRIYRNVTLTVQYIGTIGVAINTGAFVSILYREIPKVSA